ncbi:MAG TPA: GNAT family N-acetyltransferase [Gaiellaceae bacterium]|nr:GNAT family N-acetyltransferase [Gaiellaceae bacterium]
MSSAVIRVARPSADLAWRALAGGETVGAVKAFVRPDERCFVFFESCRPDAYGLLLGAVAEELGRDLYVIVDEADEARRSLYERLGFVVNRRESHYLVPTDPTITGLRDLEPPPGFVFIDAEQVDEDRLRVLDDALRQDVPGTDGWRWDEAGFREETFESPSFDPAAYLIAVDQTSRKYAGLTRVWNNPKGPKLGLIGVLPAHRRRGLARALLARAFDVLAERGKSEVFAEVDDANVASTSLLEALGARRTGGSIELIRHGNESDSHPPPEPGFAARGSLRQKRLSQRALRRLHYR